MDTAFKVKEFAHIEKMHDMQNKQDILMAQQKLLVTDLEQQGAHTLATFEHEIGFKPSQGVDNIRALVRPALTAGVLYLAYINPYVYLSLASGVIMWWFSSRVKLPRT